MNNRNDEMAEWLNEPSSTSDDKTLDWFFEYYVLSEQETLTDQEKVKLSALKKSLFGDGAPTNEELSQYPYLFANAPAQTQAGQVVASSKRGRPKKNNEIKIDGFNGRIFTNHAKQAAFEVWLDLSRGEHHVTAKELFNELYRIASDYNPVLTEWSVIDDTTLHFKTNSLRFSSLNTGGFIRDFEEAKSFLSTNNNKN